MYPSGKMLRFTSRPLLLPEEWSHNIHWIISCVGLRAGLDVDLNRKKSWCQESNPSHPARNQSLQWVIATHPFVTLLWRCSRWLCIVTIVKCRTLRWVRHVARMGKTRTVQHFGGETSWITWAWKTKKQKETLRWILERYGEMWIEVALDLVKWRFLALSVLHFRYLLQSNQDMPRARHVHILQRRNAWKIWERFQ
jgi:hypothetical protein